MRRSRKSGALSTGDGRRRPASRRRAAEDARLDGGEDLGGQPVERTFAARSRVVQYRWSSGDVAFESTAKRSRRGDGEPETWLGVPRFWSDREELAMASDVERQDSALWARVDTGTDAAGLADYLARVTAVEGVGGVAAACLRRPARRRGGSGPGRRLRDRR